MLFRSASPLPLCPVSPLPLCPASPLFALPPPALSDASGLRLPRAHLPQAPPPPKLGLIRVAEQEALPSLGPLGVLLACCLPCPVDPGTGSGLGQELMAFLLCHFMLLTIPPPQEISLRGICFLRRHVLQPAGQRLSHWQWSPLSPAPSPRGLWGFSLSRALPGLTHVSWVLLSVTQAQLPPHSSHNTGLVRGGTHEWAGASHHRVFCLGPKHGRARGPRSPAGRSQGPHLAHQLVTLQGERAGGRGPRGEDIQRSRGSGPLPGLK